MEGYIGCCFFFRPVTYILAMVPPIGMKFCMSVLDRYFPILGAMPQGNHTGHVTANISQVLSCGITCHRA